MKRTSLKHLSTLAAVVSLEFYDMFKSDSVMRSRKDDFFKYSLNDAIWDTTNGWNDNYWYTGCDKAAEDMFGADIRTAVKDRGYDLSYIDQDSTNYDEDIADEFKQDITRAYCDASFGAEESKFYEYVLRDVEAFIAEVDAPYYTLLAFTPERGKRGEEGYQPPQEKEVETVHEATSVRFGFTREWHQQYIAGLNDHYAEVPASHYMHGFKYTYNPDCIEDDTEQFVKGDTKKIDTDYRIQEFASEQDVIDRFMDISEALPMMQRATLARQQAAEFDTNHWAWVARTTTRMTTQENHHG